MSPQQVQGMPADKRSDIWAYGVCLYEALTASRPFAGANASAVLAEVLKEDPDLDRVDPRLRPIVERCLQKDPARRYRDIGDVRLDLEAAGERPEVEAPPRRRGAREKVAWLVALAAAAVAAWVLWTRPVPSSEPSTVGATRLSIATPDLIPEESFSGLAVSPDGRTVVYLGEVGGRHCLMRRDLDALESAPIAGTEGSWGFQFFSPDGKWLAHMSRDYVLQKLPIEGGRPVDLAHGQLWGGGDWGANGTIVIGNTSDGRIARLSEAGGELVPFTTLAEGEALHGHPWLLPGGEAILFTAQREGSPLIAAQRLDESGHRSLFEGEHPVLLPNGHLVFTRGNGLWAVRFDADRLEPVGEPVPLLDEPFTPRGFTTFAGSRSGTLVYTPRSAGVRGPLVWLDRTGREASVGLPPGDFMHPRVSPDGRRIAFVSVDGDEGYGRRGRSDVLILDGNSAQPRVVLSNNVANESPVWTPDGRGLVFRGRSLTEESLWFYDESRIRDLGTHSYDTVTPSDWAPGGLVLTSFARSETHGDLFTVSSETGEKKELLAKVSDEDLPVLSPDRRWLAYQDQTGAEEQILIRPFPSVESGGPWRITEGSFPAWNQDGSELFFIRDEAIWSVAMSAEPPFVKGDPILLVRGPYFDDPFFSRPYDYDPHTDRFLVVRREVSRRSLVVVQNLDQELERRFAAQ
jgi:serine/threonine-protein kinase